MTAVQTTEQPSEESFGRQSRIIAFVVAVAFFMQILDGTIVTTSLPQMATTFGVEPVSMSIGITVYLLTMAAFVPLAGWAGDRYGARRVFLASITLFTVASLFCGLSGNLTEFVIARAVQGIGSALMTPVGRIIVLRNARKSDLVHAMSMITWPALTAPVIGPILGSFITTYLSWHWNFLINIPIGIIGLGLVLRFVPDQREEKVPRLDLVGFFQSAAGLTFLLAGLEFVVQGTTGLPVSVGLIAAGAVFSVIATRHFMRVDAPLLDLSAFKVQTFAMSTLSAGTASRLAINATPFLLPLLFQVGFGLSAIDAGTYLLFYFAGNLGMKAITTQTLKAFGFRNVLVINGLISSISIGSFALLSPATPDWATYILLLAAGLSRSMNFTALNTLGFADIHAAQRSSASTLSSMLQQVSLLLGVAVAAAVLNLSRTIHGGVALSAIDFRWAFLVVALIGAVSSLRFLSLPRDAGAEVSRHKIKA
ncbi:MFS transporter [Rhizobium rhizogenes]|uniref:MFS transporter n=1 Tax=Rhizobium rhizogenes TaxID=359 RepID=UPI0006480D67|nr:MFS transporter [Rhizobium rhizogenes]